MRMHDARCIHYPVTRISHLTSHTVQTTPTPLRAGIIGCDTSHAVEFTKILNDRAAPGSSFAVRATSAFPGGSADLPESVGRLETFTSQLRGQGIEIVERVEIPDDLVPSDARVEIEAKKAAGYYTNGLVPESVDLDAVTGRKLND